MAYLNRLYAKHRLAVNFFAPSMKLLSKTRTGSRVKKIYDEAKTPWKRLQEASTAVQDNALILTPGDIDRVTRQYEAINPAQLRRDIDELEMGLRRLSLPDPAPLKLDLGNPLTASTIEGTSTPQMRAGGDPLG